MINILIGISEHFHNNYSAETLEVWSKIVFESYKDQISYRGLFYAYSAANWEITYLHLYQCLEDVFNYQTIRDLYSSLEIETCLDDFESLFTEKLKWHADPEAAINLILSKMGDGHTGYLLLKKHSDQMGMGLAHWIYQMRNRIVHQSDEALIDSRNDQKWDEIIRGMLYIITFIL